MLTAIFYPNSPQEVILVRVSPFHLFFIFFLLDNCVDAPILDICSDRNLSELVYENDVMLLSEDPINVQVFSVV